MRTILAGALLLAATVSPAAAQPMSGRVQPDRLDLGTVYAGATAEASFVVMERGTDPAVKFEVSAPKFVTVLGKTTDVHEYGSDDSFVRGVVEIAVDTAAAGEWRGEVTVTLGKTTAKVPVSATVKPHDPAAVRVLVAGTPFSAYSTEHGLDFGAWTKLAAAAPLDVSYLVVRRGKPPVLRDLNLRRYDSLLLTPGALCQQDEADVRRARAFAEGGGRVVVAANHFYRGSVRGANAVLAGYGLEVQDEEARALAASDQTINRDALADDVVQAGVGSARFFRGSPVRVVDPAAGRVLVRAAGVGKDGDGFVAVGRAGAGSVVAVGQSLWWSWVGPERAGDSDNARLLQWLLQKPRKTT